MEFDITKVVYVKSNGELSNNVDLSMVGFIADSIANLQKFVENEEKDISYGILINIDTLKDRNSFQVSGGKYKFNGTYFYPTGVVKYRPYTWEERRDLMGACAKYKKGEEEFMIYNLYVNSSKEFIINDLPAQRFLEICTWLDGSPCGVPVKE